MLLFADDVVLLSHSLSGLRQQFDAFDSFCNVNRLVVSAAKTKLLVTGTHTDCCVG